MNRRRSKIPAKSQRKFTQSTLFSSVMFNNKKEASESQGQSQLVELSDDSDIEIVQEEYVTVKAEPSLFVKPDDEVDVTVKTEPSLFVKPDDEDDVKLGNEVKEEDEEKVVQEMIDTDVIECPICGLNLNNLTISLRVSHVDDCFNFGIVTDSSFQTSTKSGYIYKSMKLKNDSSCQVNMDDDAVAETANLTKRTNSNSPSKLEEKKKPKREKNPIPDLKIMDFKNENDEIVTKLSMDAFCYKQNDEIQHYFLSHFHADHYMGITKGWCNGQIYCSSITKKLLIMRFKVDENIITDLKFNETTIVPDTQVKVTLLEANHCPGSAIFLFENMLTGGKILHCGDFRVSFEMMKSLQGVSIDHCYLDTTYLNPTYSFPKQEHVINVVSEFCHKLVKGDYSGLKLQKRVTDFFDNTLRGGNGGTKKKNYLICVGTYTIGKERIAIDIAKKLGVKLYANLTKREILSTFQWEELDDLITQDPFETHVHLIPMRYLNNENLENYFQPYKQHFHNIIAFKPTGWTFISNSSIKWMNDLSKNEILLRICRDMENDARFNLAKIESQFKSDRVIQIYAVPYSEHSSFRELSFFCILMDMKRIIPTVNTHNLESIREMELWIKEWKSVREQGLLSFDQF